MRPAALLVTLAVFSACSGEKGIVVYNSPPAASIFEPVDQAMYEQGDVVRFFGQVTDDGPVETLQTDWTSSRDGLLDDFTTPDADGNIIFETDQLSPGQHVITLRVTDESNLQARSSVTINVEEVPEIPSIQVIRPLSSDRGVEDRPYVFQAKVSDGQDTPDKLIVELSANPGGFVCFMVPDGSGNAECTASMALGQYLLDFVVTDSDDNTASARATYQVVSPGDFDADGDGFSPNAGDCDDGNANVFPGAPELCDGIDNDCNVATEIDVGSACYDDDGDGYCELPPCVNSAETLPDCDDGNQLIAPNAEETRDGRDNNCDGRIDEGTTAWDNDGDGFCSVPPCQNVANNQADCDDTNNQINPGRPEVCGDGLDNNCNGLLNEQNAQGCNPYYLDNDGDGHGVPGASQCWCDPGSPPYTGANALDCYDVNPNVYPGQTAYFSGHRGDGSFDYDCDNAVIQRWRGITGGCAFQLAPFECDLNGAGWIGFEPQCGQSGQYVQDCNSRYDIGCILLNGCLNNLTLCSNCWDCDPSITPQAQQCR